MLTGTLPFLSSPWKLLLVVFVPLLALVTVGTVCFVGGMVPLLFALCLFVTLVAFSQLRLASLTIAYVIADHSCQFFKRVIFLIGPQSQWVYYGFQVLPMLILAVAAISALFTISKLKLPTSTKFLVGYIGVSVLASIINMRAISLQWGLAGFQGQALPFFALIVGMALPLGFMTKISRVLITLILISVPYGLYQFFIGPTSVDRAWAAATKDFSIEGYKVYASMYSNAWDFRPFSYYADHTTWGFFLAIASIGLLAAAGARKLTRKWLFLALPMALVGMVICETRVVLLGFIASLIVYRVIRPRMLRRPTLLLASVIVAFAVVVNAGDYAFQNFNFGGYSNAILNRYSTVGTIAARTSAWRLFLKNLPLHWLLGTGYGYANLDPTVTLAEEIFSHNMFVEGLVLTGLPGLIMLLGFFYTWMREAFWVARVSSEAVGRMSLWVIALAVGLLMTGNLQGMLFMNTYYCLFLGLVSGEWMRLQATRAVVAQLVPEPRVRPSLTQVFAK